MCSEGLLNSEVLPPIGAVRTFSQGSEGVQQMIIFIVLVQYSIYSHGSECYSNES